MRIDKLNPSILRAVISILQCGYPVRADEGERADKIYNLWDKI